MTDMPTRRSLRETLAEPASYAKAIIAAAAAVAGAFLTALLPYIQDGQTLAQVPTVGWVTAAIAALSLGGITGGVVYATPNRT